MPDSPTPADYARRRRRSPAVCANCGQVFAALGGQRYCTPRCRNTATVRAKRARRRAQPS